MAESHIHVVGWDHHNSSVAVREQVAVVEAAITERVQAVRDCGFASEVLLISTCNRTEYYFWSASNPTPLLMQFLQSQESHSPAVEAEAFYHQGERAVEHIFRVVSSLESMVLGEYQIQHQVKRCYELAQEARTVDKHIHAIFQQALAVGKMVRNQTAIGAHKMSVASVGVDLAEHIHGDLSNSRVLMCGAGEMAELCLTHLLEHGVTQVGIVNRSAERALALVQQFAPRQVSCATHAWSDLAQHIAQYDIIVSSTGAPHVIVHAQDVLPTLNKRRDPIMFIDLAVPRDIDPEIGSSENCYLYNIDHLDRIVGENRQLRGDEVSQAEAVVQQQVASFFRRTHKQTNRMLAHIAHSFRDELEEECDRLAHRLGADAQQEQALRAGMDRLLAKVRYRLLQTCKHHADNPAVMAALSEIVAQPDTNDDVKSA